MALALRVAVKRSFPSAAAARCTRRFATSADSAAGTAVPSDAEVAEAWEERKPPKKFVRYDAMDPFNFDSQLTEDEVMIRDGVRDFCQDSLLPRVQEGFRDEEFDRTMVSSRRQGAALSRSAPRLPVADRCARVAVPGDGPDGHARLHDHGLRLPRHLLRGLRPHRARG